MRPRSGTYAVLLLALLSGCLPYSCRPGESTSLVPSDSLSRQIAAEIPADSLDLVWSISDPLEYPRTVKFGSDESVVYVSDVGRNVVFAVNAEAHVVREIETVDVPYIAGLQGDTLAVFSPAELTINLLVDGRLAESISIEDEDRAETSLVYAAYGPDVFYKRISPDDAGFIAEVARSGQFSRRYPLAGPQWRHAGLMLMWGDTLVSLSGFRPVIDLVSTREKAGSPTGSSAPLDSLALRGFDSPMLARSRSFMLGDVTEAPLLSSSAAVSGPHLFVLNIRAGWLQVDVFDRDGVLQHRLVERKPNYQKSFFPQDIDVRRKEDGIYEIAVVLTKPSPELRLYSWHGPN